MSKTSPRHAAITAHQNHDLFRAGAFGQKPLVLRCSEVFNEVQKPFEAVEISVVMASAELSNGVRCGALKNEYRLSRRSLQQGSTTCMRPLTSFANSCASMAAILRDAHPCARSTKPPQPGKKTFTWTSRGCSSTFTVSKLCDDKTLDQEAAIEVLPPRPTLLNKQPRPSLECRERQLREKQSPPRLPATLASNDRAVK